MDPETMRKTEALSRTSGWVRLLVVPWMAAAVLAVFFGGQQVKQVWEIRQGRLTPSEAVLERMVETERAKRVMTAVERLGFLAFFFVFLVWMYKANANARRLGAKRMTITPLMGALRFFVPLANLWMPYQGVKEIWRGSHDPEAPPRGPAPSLLRWWWSLWLANALLLAVGSFLLDPDKAPGGAVNWFLIGNGVLVLGWLLGLPLGVLIWKLTGRVAGAQSERLKKMRYGMAAQAGPPMLETEATS